MTFQILSLSGGGYLGLYTASVLAELEEKAKRPLRECFDLIAGTSIGGLVALALAAGVPAAVIRDAIAGHGSELFSTLLPKRGPVSTLRFLISVFRPQYEPEKLRSIIDHLVGQDLTIGSLQNNVIVPAVNLTNGQPKVFKTPHHHTFEYDWRLKVSDVALATSAAPTYFPLAKIGHELFADGGLFANSPDLLAAHEAMHFFGEIETSLRLLSVGTTTSRFSFSHARGQNYGVWKWARDARLVNVIIASQQQLTDFMMRHRFGGEYVRIDAVPSREQERDLGLDIATKSATETIRGLAESTVREYASNPTLKEILKHQNRPTRFFYGPLSNG